MPEKSQFYLSKRLIIGLSTLVTLVGASSNSFAADSIQLCENLKTGEHIMIKERPVKIVEMNKSRRAGKDNKHRYYLVGLDVFTGRKYEDGCLTGLEMKVVDVVRTEYQATYIDDGFVTLMGSDGETREDLKLPEGNIGKEIEARINKGDKALVTVLEAAGEEQIVGVKDANPSENAQKLH